MVCVPVDCLSGNGVCVAGSNVERKQKADSPVDQLAREL